MVRNSPPDASLPPVSTKSDFVSSLTIGFPDAEQACGEDSSCMNRLMQIECVQGDCKCGENCQNQRYVFGLHYIVVRKLMSAFASSLRFQRKQYAQIDIVKTEKKGYGVRTKEALPA